MYSILLIDLVHSDQVTKCESCMIYEPPSTVIIDDSDEYIQYLYNNNNNNKTNHIQTIHELLAIMIAGLMRQIRFIANNKTYSAEDYKIWLSTKVEVEQYLNHHYKK